MGGWRRSPGNPSPVPISNSFDPIFAKYAGRLPVAFLRALAYRESSFRPTLHDGPAYGLLQTVPQVVDSYNQRFGTHYSYTDMFDPDLNTKVATELMNRIVAGYQKHPDPNMKENWNNPEFVKLVIAGWNSGYSEAGGVGKVASYLEQRGIPVTHDHVFAYAPAAGATKHLSDPVKYNWQRSVNDLYFQQGDAGSVGLSRLALAALAVGGGLFAAVLWRNR